MSIYQFMSANKNILKVFTGALIGMAAVSGIALSFTFIGYLLLLASVCTALLVNLTFFKELAAVIGAVGVLNIAPISSDTGTLHALILIIITFSLLLGPYLLFRYLYKSRALEYKFIGNIPIARKYYLYFFCIIAIGYFILPFYLKNTGAYRTWPSPNDTGDLVRLFIGVNYLGLWDEMFFVCTVLSIYRRHFTFWTANIFTSLIFSSFLYRIGFIGWGTVMIVFFTLLQGLIYKQTKSLPFVVAIHLTFDLILYCAIVNAHNPHLLNIFVT